MADDVTRTRQVTAMPAARRQAHLVIVSGEGSGQRVAIERDTLVIGRSRDTDLQLDVDGVSRKHARITRSGQHTLSLVDLGAKNGTYLNGERIDVAALHHGDRIQIGEIVLQIVITDPEAAGVPAADAAAPDPLDELSAREREVAVHVARGLTNAEIAAALGISRRTVATHLERIYERLGIHSRAALAHRVVRQGEPG